MSAVAYEMTETEFALVERVMSTPAAGAALAALTIQLLDKAGLEAAFNDDHDLADQLFAVSDRIEVAEIAESIAEARASLSGDVVAYTDHLDALEEQVVQRAKDLGL